jgi:hypothetical protein
MRPAMLQPMNEEMDCRSWVIRPTFSSPSSKSLPTRLGPDTPPLTRDARMRRRLHDFGHAYAAAADPQAINQVEYSQRSLRALR